MALEEAMRKRRLLFSLLAMVTTLVALWLFWPRTAITRENATKIRVGMTVAEIETILRGPPRSDVSGPVVVDMRRDNSEQEWAADTADELMNMQRHIAKRSDSTVVWQSDDVFIWVQLEDGRISASGYYPVHRRSESPLDMLRRWLRL